MGSIIEIQNKKSFLNKLFEQYGQILGLESGVLICSFFVEFSTIIYTQIIVMPIIIVILISKFNKPINYIIINKTNKIFNFNTSKALNSHQTIEIPFEKILVIRKWKWLLNFYQEVIEIKSGSILVIVIPINKSNSKFINLFLTELSDLKDFNYIGEEQFKIK